jgi:Mor family transcriptional regulator
VTNVENKNDLEKLEAILGPENFFKLAEHFAGKQLYFPKQILREKKREAIRREYRQGVRFGELVNRYGYTERHIRRIVKVPQKMPGDEPDGRLARFINKVLAIFKRQGRT